MNDAEKEYRAALASLDALLDDEGQGCDDCRDEIVRLNRIIADYQAMLDKGGAGNHDVEDGGVPVP